MTERAQPCAHCGLPAPLPAAPGERTFCCPGCAAVYEALHASGLEGFYTLREASGGEACPVGPSAEAPVNAELDAPHFLQEHTQGFPDGTRSAELAVDGVHCAGCVWVAERLPWVFPGVSEARLDLGRARLRVRWDPAQVQLSAVAAWLGRFGYRLHPLRRDRVVQRSAAERRLLIKVGVAWALAGNVMLLASAFYAGLEATRDPWMTRGALILSALLATGSVIYGGGDFFRRAWESARAVATGQGLRALSIDAPIALGIGVGYAHSVFLSLQDSTEVWFDSVAVLIAALLTARWLQVRGRRVAGDAAERLLALLPHAARRLEASGEESLVPVESLAAGDVVRVRPGEAFPADGVVVAGRSSVNRAVLTGESRPEGVSEGGEIQAGAINLSAPLEIRVEAAGARSRVGRLLEWLEERATSRAPIVQWADRISGVFIAAVLGAAAVTGAVWGVLEPSQAVAHAVALLVVACPCALGMATPLALTVAAGKAARRGIFVKHDDVLQALAGANTVVLDKTGTLTRGQMTLVERAGDEAALRLAARLERHSLHPIAAALVAAWPDEVAAAVEDMEEIVGAGLVGQVDGHRVEVGRPAWLAERLALPADEPLRQRAEAAASRGLTPVLVAVDGQLAALACLGDPPRDEAAALVARLQSEGREVFILSGDHPAAVAWLAERLGIPADRARGAVSPEEKVAFIEALTQRPDRAVVMVGDGVNDARALQAAHVGVAVQGSAEASVVGADVFLTRPGLGPVLELLDGSRDTLRTVRRSLTFSLIYNLVGVSAAMLGLMSPLAAAIAMPLSSLLVVASSLLQRSFRAPQPAAPVPATPPAPPVETAGAPRGAEVLG